MFGSKSKGTLVATLAWAGLCWGQTPVQPSSQGTGAERIITVQEDGKETHQCKITAEVIQSDGTRSLEVEDLQTGEQFNLAEGDQQALPAQELPANSVGRIHTSNHLVPVSIGPLEGPEIQQPEMIQVSGPETVSPGSMDDTEMPVPATPPSENKNSLGSTQTTIIQTVPFSNMTDPTHPPKKVGLLSHIFHRSKSANVDNSTPGLTSEPMVTEVNAPSTATVGSSSQVAPVNSFSSGPIVNQAALPVVVAPAQASDWHQSWGKADDHSPSKSSRFPVVKGDTKESHTAAKVDDSTWVIPAEENVSGAAASPESPWRAEDKPAIVPANQVQTAIPNSQVSSQTPAKPGATAKTEAPATKSPSPDLAGINLPQADTSRPDPLKDMDIIGHVPEKKDKASAGETSAADKPVSAGNGINGPGSLSGLPANPGYFPMGVTNAFTPTLPPQRSQASAAFSGKPSNPPSGSMGVRQAGYLPGSGTVQQAYSAGYNRPGQGIITVPSYVPMDMGAYQSGVLMPHGQGVTPVGYYPLSGGPPNSPEGLAAMLKNALFPSQREWAAQNMVGEWGNNPVVINALKQAAREDPAATVRASCVRGLVRVETDRKTLIATLDSLKNDPNPDVQQEIGEAKNQLDGKWINTRELMPIKSVKGR